MGRYLLVAHQTADSPELRGRVLELVRQDPAAEFVLLVPATPISVLTSVGGENRTAVGLARSRADVRRVKARAFRSLRHHVVSGSQRRSRCSLEGVALP